MYFNFHLRNKIKCRDTKEGGQHIQLSRKSSWDSNYFSNWLGIVQHSDMSQIIYYFFRKNLFISKN